MSKRRTDFEKLIQDQYISVSTIQRVLGLSDKKFAVEIFKKAQTEDESDGYMNPYDNQVRRDKVLELLGWDYDRMVKSYLAGKGE